MKKKYNLIKLKAILDDNSSNILPPPLHYVQMGGVLMTLYTKPHLSYKSQVELLKYRNLTVVDEDFAILKLKHISYYRLSAYFIPFYSQKDKFKDETKFEDILDVYHFDKELRGITFNAIEKIEIFLRASIAYNFSKKCGFFCHLFDENFCIKNEQDFIWLREDIKKETNRSKEHFVKNYKRKYQNDDLPIWMVVEIISFGTLSKLYSLLCNDIEKEILNGIDLPSTVFKNWLHVFSYIRNTVAHHSRLWNKRFVIKAKIPKRKKDFQGIVNDKYFTFAVMTHYILTAINDTYDFKKELISLFNKYPNIDKTQMGFTDDWEKMQIWK